MFGAEVVPTTPPDNSVVSMRLYGKAKNLAGRAEDISPGHVAEEPVSS